eukprot:s2760_g6.t1
MALRGLASLLANPDRQLWQPQPTHHWTHKWAHHAGHNAFSATHKYEQLLRNISRIVRKSAVAQDPSEDPISSTNVGSSVGRGNQFITNTDVNYTTVNMSWVWALLAVLAVVLLVVAAIRLGPMAPLMLRFGHAEAGCYPKSKPKQNQCGGVDLEHLNMKFLVLHDIFVTIVIPCHSFFASGWIGPPSLKPNDLTALKTFSDVYRIVQLELEEDVTLGRSWQRMTDFDSQSLPCCNLTLGHKTETFYYIGERQVAVTPALEWNDQYPSALRGFLIQLAKDSSVWAW